MLLLLLDLVLQLERMYSVGPMVWDGSGAWFCGTVISGAGLGAAVQTFFPFFSCVASVAVAATHLQFWL